MVCVDVIVVAFRHTTILEFCLRQKTLLLTVLALAVVLFVVLPGQTTSLTSFDILSLPKDEYSRSHAGSGRLVPESRQDTFENVHLEEKNADDAWLDRSNNSHPITPSIVSRRYAWTHQTYSTLVLERYNTYVPVNGICLRPAANAQQFCYTTALAVPLTDAPICLMDHIFVYSTYTHAGQVVSLADIALPLYTFRTRIFFCPSGVPATVAQLDLGVWVQRNFKHITHTSVFIRCPADDASIALNSLGFLVVNYNGDCSFSAKQMDATYNKPQTTYLALLATPITRSFQQAWPNLPVRGNAFLKLPNVPKAPGMPFQFSTCAMGGVIDTDAHFLTAWLWHLRNKVLVEHVILYIAPEGFHLDSPNIDGTLVKQYLEEGFLTLVPWASRFLNGRQVYYRSQQLAYSDYAYRFRGLCHWTLLADTDDFFVNWPHDHQIAPVISSSLAPNPNLEVLQFNWPLFLPQCHNVSGHGPPFDSNWILSNITYGQLNHPTPKTIVDTHTKLELHIHYTKGKSAALHAPGLAIYHIRAGPRADLRLNNFNETECKRFALKDFDSEQRKTRVI